MRIIVGKFKGMTIEAPRGLLSRPPLAVIRESVFNIIGPSIDGRGVLDLFAGSGSLGIEALSRGAARVHFVDSSRRSVEIIARNVRKLGVMETCTVTRDDVLGFIRKYDGPPFDLVFVDPPFLSGKVAETLAALHTSEAISEHTMVVARVHWREQFPFPETYSLVKKRKFGESVVFFLTATAAGG
ncbi:MAG: 16S rRNA (guanine(966)-N(2))-methyltransferase RsmD [Candidatus Eisenbacteria bacterium]